MLDHKHGILSIQIYSFSHVTFYVLEFKIVEKTFSGDEVIQVFDFSTNFLNSYGVLFFFRSFLREMDPFFSG